MGRSLRSRVIVASVLWTAGLLSLMHLLSLTVIHTLPASAGGHTAVVGTALGVLLMGAGFFAARRSLQPLRGLEQKVEAVTAGRATRVEGRYPAEVQAVIDRLNVMLEDRERAVVRAQAAAGDLAHALKTPLALLMREADALRASGQSELSDAIAGLVHRMTAHIDRQLTRARLAAAGPTRHDRADVHISVDGLIRVMRRLHAEREIQLVSTVPSGAAVVARAEDLDELLGNLLDNACKWARTRVEISALAQDGQLALFVDDDGPGLPADARERALRRGVRLDERAPGSGLGLAIVRDLIDHYRGTIALERSPLGGLRVCLTLPATTQGPP